MSGTSVDRDVDFTAAVFAADGRLLNHADATVTLPADTRQLLYHLSVTPCDRLTISERNRGEQAITRFLIDAFQQVIQQWGLENHPKENIILSPHGQTIDHQPYQHSTDQLVHGESIAHALGYRVVFRHRQACIPISHAAPLAPLLFRALFSHSEGQVVLINGGGIANLCVLDEQSIVAFDSGPANGPLDELIQHICHTEPDAIPADLIATTLDCGYDVNGQWARRGKVDTRLQEKLLNHPYFLNHSSKKSADRSQFNLDWVLECKGDTTWQNCITTLSHVVATTIAQAVLTHVDQHKPIQLGFYGGLKHNQFIIEQCLSELTPLDLSELHWEQLGLNPNFIESLLMAFLGFCVHQNKAVSLNYCSEQSHAMPVIPGMITSLT